MGLSLAELPCQRKLLQVFEDDSFNCNECNFYHYSCLEFSQRTQTYGMNDLTSMLSLSEWHKFVERVLRLGEQLTDF